MKKRLLAFVLSLTLILTLIPTAVFATGEVASVTIRYMVYSEQQPQGYYKTYSTTNYTSLAEAFSAAADNQDYQYGLDPGESFWYYGSSLVTLLDDVVVSNQLALNTSVELNLNGHSFTITSSGSLTGQSGSITLASPNPGTFNSCGTIGINLGPWTGDTINITGGSITGYFGVDGGTVNVSGGEFTKGFFLNNNGEGDIVATISDNAAIKDMQFYPEAQGANGYSISVAINGGYFTENPNNWLAGYARVTNYNPSERDSYYVNHNDEWTLFSALTPDQKASYDENDSYYLYDANLYSAYMTINGEVQAYDNSLNDWAVDHNIYSWRVKGAGGGGGNPTVAVTGISVTPTEAALKVGETASLTATVSPGNATNKTVTWQSDDSNVATVSNGVVTAVGEGATTITAIAGNNKKGYCHVTVSKIDTTVTLASATKTYTGEEISIGTATVKAGNTTLNTTAAIEYFSDSNYENPASPVEADTYYVLASYAGDDTYKSSTCGAVLTITPAALAADDVTLEYTNTTYSGAQLQPGVTVKFGNNTLVKDTDYTVEYGENLHSSTGGIVTVTAINPNLCGTIVKTFTITKSTVNVTGITAENKMHDGNTDATLNFGNAAVTGIKNNEITYSAIGHFSDAEIGQNKNVTIAFTWEENGGSLSDYDVSGVQSATVTANIMGAGTSPAAASTGTTDNMTVSYDTDASSAAAITAAEAIATNGAVTSSETGSNTGLTDAAEDVASMSNVLSAARQEAENQGIASDAALQVTPYFDVDVKTVEAENGTVSAIVVNITAMYKVTSTASPDAILATGVMKVNKPVEITIPVPANWTEAWVKHIVDGITYWYKATLNAGNAKFTNPHGFSDFALSQEASTVAEVNGVYFDTWQVAVDQVKEGETISLTSDAGIATVGRDISFNVSQGAFTYTINPAANYTMTTSGSLALTNYTFTYNAPISGNTGSGGGSSAATAKVPESVEKGTEFKVTVPAGKTEEVSINVPGATAGTVLYAVAADGTKTLIKDTALKDGKLVVTLTGTTTLVAEDNSKSFTDVNPLGWSKNAIDFVTARELFNGTSETTFGPTETMTRGMLMTVLARFDGADASGSDWLAKGMAWSVAKSISDGTEPNRPVTRQEIVTMLWRYAGSPVAGAQAAASLEARPDGSKVDDWAQAAMAWALDNKVINGDENGFLNPTAPAAREQVAQLFMNFVCR